MSEDVSSSPLPLPSLLSTMSSPMSPSLSPSPSTTPMAGGRDVLNQSGSYDLGLSESETGMTSAMASTTSVTTSHDNRLATVSVSVLPLTIDLSNSGGGCRSSSNININNLKCESAEDNKIDGGEVSLRLVTPPSSTNTSPVLPRPTTNVRQW
jgi:hypothetical protein